MGESNVYHTALHHHALALSVHASDSDHDRTVSSEHPSILNGFLDRMITGIRQPTGSQGKEIHYGDSQEHPKHHHCIADDPRTGFHTSNGRSHCRSYHARCRHQCLLGQLGFRTLGSALLRRNWAGVGGEPLYSIPLNHVLMTTAVNGRTCRENSFPARPTISHLLSGGAHGAASSLAMWPALSPEGMSSSGSSRTARAPLSSSLSSRDKCP